MSEFILVIAEDDPDDREILQLVLNQDFPNWKYTILKNGQALLDYLSNCTENLNHISLVLVDINMPIKNGLETLEEIKSNPRYKHIPVIGLSTANNESIVGKFLDMGGTAYFQKPYIIEEIQSLFLKLFEIAKTNITQRRDL